ncbi:MAG: AbrB family transcriptional regulator, partial [Pseudomonadota bacterium]
MPSLAGLLPIIVSLAAAALGGLLLDRANVPLAWLLGALFAVAAMGLSGLPTRVPILLRRVGQTIVGVAVGLYVTREVALELVGLAPAMIAAALASMAASVVISRWLVHHTGIDGTTAYFASLPGGVAEMSVLAQQRGGEAALVALAQSLRVVAVVILLPPAMLLLGTVGEPPPLEPTQPVRLAALALMIGS